MASTTKLPLLLPTYSQHNLAQAKTRFGKAEGDDINKPTLVRGKNKGVLDSLLIAMRNKDPSVVTVEARYKYKGVGLGAIGDLGATKIAKELPGNTTICKLDLNSNNLSDLGVLQIADGLQLNSSVEKLDLHINRFGYQGAQRLSCMLAMNSTLTYLNLRGNQVGDAGAQTLRNGLVPVKMHGRPDKQCSLTYLNLAYNGIGDIGGVGLAKGLPENTMLRTLDVSHNRLGNESAQSIASALVENSALLHLHLNANQIGDDGVVAMAQGLRLQAVVRSDKLKVEAEEAIEPASVSEDTNDIAVDVDQHDHSSDIKFRGLLSLFLGGNQLGDAAALALAHALAPSPDYSPTPEKVKRSKGDDDSEDDIEDDSEDDSEDEHGPGEEAVGSEKSMPMQVPVLATLDLSSNFLSDQGVAYLAHTLANRIRPRYWGKGGEAAEMGWGGAESDDDEGPGGGGDTSLAQRIAAYHFEQQLEKEAEEKKEKQRAEKNTTEGVHVDEQRQQKTEQSQQQQQGQEQKQQQQQQQQQQEQQQQQQQEQQQQQQEQEQQQQQQQEQQGQAQPGPIDEEAEDPELARQTALLLASWQRERWRLPHDRTDAGPLDDDPAEGGLGAVQAAARENNGNENKSNDSRSSGRHGAAAVGSAGRADSKAAPERDSKRNMSSLTRLDLSANMLGDGSAEVLALVLGGGQDQLAFDALPPPPPIAANKLTRKILKLLPSAAFSPLPSGGAHSVAARNAHGSAAERFRAQVRSAQLEASRLYPNACLSSLSLARNRLGDAGGRALAGALARNSCLRVVELKGNQVGEVGTAALSHALARSQAWRRRQHQLQQQEWEAEQEETTAEAAGIGGHSSASARARLHARTKKSAQQHEHEHESDSRAAQAEAEAEAQAVIDARAGSGVEVLDLGYNLAFSVHRAGPSAVWASQLAGQSKSGSKSKAAAERERHGFGFSRPTSGATRTGHWYAPLELTLTATDSAGATTTIRPSTSMSPAQFGSTLGSTAGGGTSSLGSHSLPVLPPSHTAGNLQHSVPFRGVFYDHELGWAQFQQTIRGVDAVDAAALDERKMLGAKDPNGTRRFDTTAPESEPELRSEAEVGLSFTASERPSTRAAMWNGAHETSDIVAQAGRMEQHLALGTSMSSMSMSMRMSDRHCQRVGQGHVNGEGHPSYTRGARSPPRAAASMSKSTCGPCRYGRRCRRVGCVYDHNTQESDRWAPKRAKFSLY